MDADAAPHHATPDLRRRRAHLLSRLLNQVDDRSLNADEIFKSYRLILDLPGGEKLLSPQDVKRIIDRLSRWPRKTPGVPARIAFQRVSLILEGVRRLRTSLLQSGAGGTREAAQWTALLLSPQLQNQLVWLITGSHRAPEIEELQEVLEILRRGFGWHTPREMEEAKDDKASNISKIRNRRQQQPQPRSTSTDRISHNLVLDLIARVARRPSSRNIVYDKEEYLLSHTATSRLIEELPLKRLITSSLSRGEDGTSHSLERMCQLFYSLWHDMQAYSGLGTDQFSWSSRLRLESKLTSRDLFLLLDDLRKDMSAGSVEEVLDRNSSLLGWQVIHNTLKEALTSGKLHVTHLHQIIWLYSQLRTAVNQFSDVQGDSALTSIVMARFFKIESQRNDVVWELYEMLRWNEVRLEMEKLRKLRAGNNKSSSSSQSRAFADGEVTSDSNGPVATLLGISVPPNMIPTDATYSILIRHYAVVEGDYEKAIQVLEDYRQSGVEDVGESDNSFSSLSASREPSIALLDSFLVGFSLRGVASEEIQDGQWRIAEEQWQTDGAAESAAPSGWRLENLIPILDMLLELPSPVEQRRREEQARYMRLHSTLTDGKMTPTSSDPSTSTATTAHRERLSASSASQQELDAADSDALSSILSPLPNAPHRVPTGIQRARGPTTRQLFFILTALRRCTGDQRPDLVLSYWRELESKFGLRREHEQQDRDSQRDTVRSRRKGAEMRSEPSKEQKGGEEEEEGGEEEEEEVVELVDSMEKVNSQGWTGWRLDRRLERLIPYMEEQAKDLQQRKEREDRDEVR